MAFRVITLFLLIIFALTSCMTSKSVEDDLNMVQMAHNMIVQANNWAQLSAHDENSLILGHHRRHHRGRGSGGGGGGRGGGGGIGALTNEDDLSGDDDVGDDSKVEESLIFGRKRHHRRHHGGGGGGGGGLPNDDNLADNGHGGHHGGHHGPDADDDPTLDDSLIFGRKRHHRRHHGGGGGGGALPNDDNLADNGHGGHHGGHHGPDADDDSTLDDSLIFGRKRHHRRHHGGGGGGGGLPNDDNLTENGHDAKDDLDDDSTLDDSLILGHHRHHRRHHGGGPGGGGGGGIGGIGGGHGGGLTSDDDSTQNGHGGHHGGHHGPDANNDEDDDSTLNDSLIFGRHRHHRRHHGGGGGGGGRDNDTTYDNTLIFGRGKSHGGGSSGHHGGGGGSGGHHGGGGGGSHGGLTNDDTTTDATSRDNGHGGGRGSGGGHHGGGGHGADDINLDSNYDNTNNNINNTNYNYQKAALTDCASLYDQAEPLLARLLESKASYTSEDGLAWISGALTSHRTCLDGLRERGMDEDDHPLAQNLTTVLNHALVAWHAKKVNSPYTKTNGESWTPEGDQYKGLLASWNPTTSRADIVVAKDGSGDYRTIKEAVNALERTTNNKGGQGRRVVVHVKAGVYDENVEIGKHLRNVMFVGEGVDRTIITGQRNYVDGHTTVGSATFRVFGDGFWARDMTFENTAGPQKHQAVALMVASDNALFYKCNIKGYQDTLYTHSLRQFYRDCKIYGTIDFIFGNAAVVFQNCDILLRKPMDRQANIITAQGRDSPYENTGISIHGSRVHPAPEFLPVRGSVKTFLGRPWKKYSRTVVAKTDLDGMIHPKGWTEWRGEYALATLYYAEYMNTGLGASTRDRVDWPGYHVLSSPKELGPFTVRNFLQGESWIMKTGVPVWTEI